MTTEPYYKCKTRPAFWNESCSGAWVKNGFALFDTFLTRWERRYNNGEELSDRDLATLAAGSPPSPAGCTIIAVQTCILERTMILPSRLRRLVL